MKKTKLFFTSCLFLISLLASSQNRSIEFDHSDWKTLLAKAKKENKIIYLDCYTTWCGPCKWMAKNIYTNDTAADFYNSNFINTKIDMEKGEGVDLAKKYEIRAYPTHLYINGDGEQIHRTCGSCQMEDFVANGKNAITPENQLSTISKKFTAGNLDRSLVPTYFAMLENACQKNDDEIATYFKSQKEADLTSSINWFLINNYVSNYSSAPFQFLENNKAAYAKLYTLDSVETKINQVYQQKLSSEKDKTEVENIRARFRNTGNKDVEKIIAQTNINFCIANKDYKGYAKAAIDFFEKYSTEISAQNYNSNAWNFYEKVDDKEQLAKAADWAKKATEMNDIYQFNDTYAAVLYKLGRKEEARKVAEKAIEQAKKSGEDFKETEELLKKINK